MVGKSFRKAMLAAILGGLSVSGASAQVPPPYVFNEIAPQGFGDRQNTKAWASAWWKGHLYVGTARAHLCMNWAGLTMVRDRWEYPPRSFVDPSGTDPDLECSADFRDLPLQAEIWRWSPQTEVWTRVFQSELIENPADPTRETARDIGIRNLIPFVDPDGTEALYAAGITSESINPGMPPPRLLRTTDGVNWTPVPQDPGTVLGELGRGNANLRGAAVYKDRLYIVAGNLHGTGPLLESANPAAGNDAFRFVTSQDINIFELIEYDGMLYLGLGSEEGYEIVKTDAETAPLQLTPVVETAGGIQYIVSHGVASMHVSKGRLFVGTDKPAELIRINPDDSWDLIVGKPRNTQTGRKEPLSGLMTAFDYVLVNHFHRMTTWDGQLFLSTNDATGFMKLYRVGQRFLHNMGYDLYVSPNGVEFGVLTLTGFDNPFDIVMRVWEPTPHGLFGGTSNPWYGLRMYKVDEVAASIDPPQHLLSERVGGLTALTWEAVPGASRYHVYRRVVRDGLEYNEIGTTTNTFYVDPDSAGRTTLHYFVTAEADDCCSSTGSNIARSPILLRAMTVGKLEAAVEEWNGGAPLPGVSSTLEEASSLLRLGDLEGARRVLSTMAEESAATVNSAQSVGVAALREEVRSRLRQRDLRGAIRLLLQARRARAALEGSSGLPLWRGDDFHFLLGRLLRRFQLVENGLLSPHRLR